MPGSLGIDLTTRVDDLLLRLDSLVARPDPDISANIAAIVARRIEAELKALFLCGQELWRLFVRLRDAIEAPRGESSRDLIAKLQLRGNRGCAANDARGGLRTLP